MSVGGSAPWEAMGAGSALLPGQPPGPGTLRLWGRSLRPAAGAAGGLCVRLSLGLFIALSQKDSAGSRKNTNLGIGALDSDSDSLPSTKGVALDTFPVFASVSCKTPRLLAASWGLSSVWP